jgi:1,4-alpha-glucan branching enzyme
MYEKARKEGSVRFRFRPSEGTRRAAVAGDFNGWKLAPMRRQKDGSFAATLAVPPGRYEYKFLIDGDWVHDPDVPEVVMNCYRTFNSVAVVR